MKRKLLLWSLVLLGALAFRPTLAAPTPRPTSGEIAYVYGGNLWLLDLADGQTRQLTTAGQNATPAWSPDGQWLTFVSRTNGNADLYRIRPDGTALTRLTTDLHDDILPTYAPDGTLFFVRVLQDWQGPVTGEEDPPVTPGPLGHSVVMQQGTGGAATVVYDLGTGTLYPPDGLSARSATRLAVSTNGQLGVDVVLLDLSVPPSRDAVPDDLDGLFGQRLADGFCAPQVVAAQAMFGQWAPGQGRIVFIGDADCADPGVQGDQDGLYIWNADQPSAPPTLLVGQPCCWGLPAWSPDAQWIVFGGWPPSEIPQEPTGLWVIPARGGTAQQIALIGSHPAWRPTGGVLPGMPATGRGAAGFPLALLVGAGSLLFVGVAVRRRRWVSGHPTAAGRE